MTSPLLRRLTLLLCLTASSGCATLGYYGQAVTGHLRLVTGREPIAEMIRSEEVPAPVRARLRTVRSMRDFASAVLSLPENRSYRYYAHLDRPYAVWNLVATPVDSLRPRRWCFPFAGCVSYRGYFSNGDAEAFARRLRREGLDVAVLGATAYSTLGWFADPVLSPMLDYPDPELAGLIFHELAHQRLYVKGDTSFNEAFATVVEETGVRRWLARHGEEAQIRAWEARRERQRAFTALLMELRDALEALYARDDAISRDALLAEKRFLFGLMRERYRALSQRYDMSRYDDWMAQDLNNAHLAMVSAYRAGVPAFEALLTCVGGDLERFYRAAGRIGEWPADRRRAWLDGKVAAPECGR